MSAGFSKFSETESEASWFPKEKMSLQKTAEVVKLIKDALIQKQLSFAAFFRRLDSNGNTLLSYPEFSKGIDEVCKLSPMVKEQLFARMDVNGIGMVDYDNFLEALQTTIVSAPKVRTADNFDWEEKMIQKLKNYISHNGITVEEAFKAFDRDFDGKVSKEDLKWALINILKVEEEEILPTKLERLFRLMDFYKTGSIQLSDVQRLVEDENPYRTSETFAKTKFAQSSNTFNWKNNAIQQLGLGISKQFDSLNESFDKISGREDKIDFNQFKEFVDKSNLLAGFNLTKQLQQQLFSEIDTHKKGYITEHDWSLAFSQFHWGSQLIIEISNALQVAFADVHSSFQFLLDFRKEKKGNTLTRADFLKAFKSLTNNRFSNNDLIKVWNEIAGEKHNHLSKDRFCEQFEHLNYRGASTLVRGASASSKGKTLIVTNNSSMPKWESDILEKIRQLILAVPVPLKDVFKQFDSDASGKLSSQEFRNGIRKLGLGLTSREIDMLMV